MWSAIAPSNPIQSNQIRDRVLKATLNLIVLMRLKSYSRHRRSHFCYMEGLMRRVASYEASDRTRGSIEK